MNVAFAGTPRFAATILRGLIASEHTVGLVISQPDSRKGRGRRTVKPPVAELALAGGLRLRQPERISEVAEEISRHDALIVAAYGQILRPDTLYAAPNGAWNVHASLLPAYRGAAPVERAIMNGETETGISIMRMDEGLDTGPVALQEKVPISPETTGGELTEILAKVGAETIVRAMTMLEKGELNPTEQDGARASYAEKISPEERTIQWDRGASEVHNLIRALSPHIGARTYHPAIEGPIKVLASRVSDGDSSSLGVGEIHAEKGRILVGCGEGILEILRLQLPGGKPLRAEEFLHGYSLEGLFR